MGARTNYKIVHSVNREQDINVYSHSDGEDSVNTFRNAIRHAMPRLNDDSYFIRILVNALQGDHNSEIGYGIYIGEEIVHEEEYDYKEINLLDKTVTIGEDTMPINDFIGLKVKESV